jgi:hypothetical protein
MIRNSNYSIFKFIEYFILIFERNPLPSTLYDTKNNSHHIHQNSSNQSEHLIDLPSDIFLSSQKSNNYNPFLFSAI